MNPSTDWRSDASLEHLQQRANLLTQVRAFFASRGVLEVDTPLLSASGNTDPNIESFVASCVQGQHQFYLHTSPEFPMKRLLAQGIGAIFQICKVFRCDELGRWHNPEFTMLEWYRPAWTYQQLMDEVDALVSQVLNIDAAKRISVQELFEHYLFLNIHQASVNDLRQCALKHGIGLSSSYVENDEIDVWRDLLFTHVVQPKLKDEAAVFIFDFPESQAALAKINKGFPATAMRFELFVKGIELANGYQELTDAEHLKLRMQAENETRLQRGQLPVIMDKHLIAAQHHGLPECSGVALGFDRLLMLQLGIENIRETMSFSINKA
ncbi:MAG: EF-P lysine aminoacylase EpmA [Gammaproteobacteria bacterium]|nr:EF-P lysine aminoacylase EpmA [Gammaproteobacteria bacterium]MDH5729488.1 EF-P lysine aminoacylase EpmA [Gammaproteobacteria bacterium]